MGPGIKGWKQEWPHIMSFAMTHWGLYVLVPTLVFAGLEVLVPWETQQGFRWSIRHSCKWPFWIPYTWDQQARTGVAALNRLGVIKRWECCATTGIKEYVWNSSDPLGTLPVTLLSKYNCELMSAAILNWEEYGSLWLSSSGISFWENQKQTRHWGRRSSSWGRGGCRMVPGEGQIMNISWSL